VWFDIFFSISQTPAQGKLPTESEMFRNFFDQVEAADELRFGTAWVAESHFSSEVQKSHKKPVIPHWNGEVGLNTDILQLSHKVFSRTRHIEMGSAVMNIICNGGPIAAAERVATFGALHGLDPEEKRKLHIGFSAGRFDFMNRTTGIDARNAVEELSWPIVKGKIFTEASEIFLRLLRGETLSGDQIRSSFLSASDFRSPEEWEKVLKIAKAKDKEKILLERRWNFEATKIIPQDWRRELIQPVIGSHDPKLQEYVNTISPVQVFNLSITKPEIIEDTHRRMREHYHKSGGRWQRSYMPRTVFVFINEQEGLSATQKSKAAHEEANEALGAYWKALEGTLDPKKVQGASNNALVGNAEEIAQQMTERFHAEDRLMLWFDFFNHNNARVISNMEAFMKKVVPLLGPPANEKKL
jgi:alkanesulfonate monooxygenase SsuD/methylene tetrahydromethanopterin reductase-like flavin-dependent oxidoreductase (luciferase family)